ncbi:histidine phosphatase family protein [Paucilactobacillus suebicus]|uniref:Phosphoglycerate mutase n=1 Tax=Paucilactobacillus suebicus DSM 5007 = KCTC 3549 TaxID=1423807 RepID=A0A0R1VYX3_9LACO|nr:histidine phosphatase family protein [Paucilactobacillus suebicus]KRM10872.1 phosphoglycerate mutase [Paucilactobacillus suebicus DSM 5007 = KCTC 3549]
MSQQTIYFVRHGKTLLNMFNRMQGWIDSDLTSEGKADAVNVGKRLATTHFDAAISSNTGRAIATRDLILKQLTVQPNIIEKTKDFREVLFGEYEGRDSDEIWNEIGTPYGYHTQDEIIHDKGLRGARELMKAEDSSNLAETYDDVVKRWQVGINHIKEACPKDANILVVTHGTALRTFADYLGVNTIGNYPENGSVSILTIHNGEEEFTSYNVKD